MRPGDTVAERFEIEESLGAGGTADVFRAHDRERGATVAIKFLRMAVGVLVQRFAREASLLARLSHPAIVEYVAHGTTADGTPYLAMEWVAGETLAGRLAGEGMTAVEAVAVARRLADALSVAHEHGVVHRDVKPANILFPEGAPKRVKLIDFGVARPAQQSHGLTQTGMLVGTPAYMSPEQSRGLRELDARTDVFSLGSVLYECLTGRPPFAGSHMMAIQAKILLSHPAPVRALCPEVPKELAGLVERMMAKHPDQRPDGCAEVARSLAALGEIPEGPRRRSRAALDADATQIAPTLPAEISFVVLAANIAKSDAAEAVAAEMREREGAMRGELEPLGGHLEILGDGSLVVTVTGDGELAETAACAARCAFVLRAHAPRAVIGVTCAPPERERTLEGALDVGVQRLAEEQMQAIFARWAAPGAEAGAIRIDQTTARLLQGRYTVSQGKTGRWYLAG